MGVRSPSEAAAHFEALWRSGLIEGRLDTACRAVVDVAVAAGAVAASVVVFDGSRRWCAARSDALPGQWWATDAPSGWYRAAGAAIRATDGTVIGELAAFDQVPAEAPEPPSTVLVALARLVEDLVARHTADRSAITSAVAVVDAESNLLSVTPSITELTGWGVDERVGQSVLELIHPSDAALAVEGFTTSVRFAGRKTPMDVRLAGPDGSWVPVAVTADNRLDDPLVAAIVFELVDTRQRSGLDALLAGQARILELVARGAPVGDVATAIVGLIEDHVDGARAWVAEVSEGAQVLLPLTPWPGSSLAEHLARIEVAPVALPAGVAAWRHQALIVADVTSEPLWDAARAAALADAVAADWALPAATGSGRALGVVDVLLDRPGLPTGAEHRVLHLAAQLLAVALERHRAETRLAHQATHDPLTGLPNRAFLADRFTDPASGSDHPHSLLVCEAAGLEAVYRTFGYGAADDLLAALADRLCTLLRGSDIAVRLGDKQFAVLLDDEAEADDAVAVARRLLGAMTEPFHVYGREVFVDLRIGIASSTRPTDRLLLEADVALTRAKAQPGAGFELFDPSMLRGMLEQVDLEAELRRALSRDELVVHYQPKVDLASGEVVGAEALVRWDHPTRGLVPPDEFIPLLEESGLIVPAGRRILDIACHDAAAWPAHLGLGRVVTVAVNVSIRQLEDPSFPEAVLAACRTASIGTAALVLEITETALSERHEQALTSLLELHAAGVTVSIDDFGTGYSSLVRLRDFPVDEIKIDRAFVAEIRDDGQPAPLVAAMIALANGLGLRTVAEGVETEAQARLLRRLGCHQAQGYLFARPGPALVTPAIRT